MTVTNRPETSAPPSTISSAHAKFEAQFTAAANGLPDGGGAVFGYDALGRRLRTFQLSDQPERRTASPQ